MQSGFAVRSPAAVGAGGSAPQREARRPPRAARRPAACSAIRTTRRVQQCHRTVSSNAGPGEGGSDAGVGRFAGGAAEGTRIVSISLRNLFVFSVTTSPLLSLWLRNLPFCFSCSFFFVLFFSKKMLHDSVCPCSLLEFRSAFTFMILFINFILCSVQDIGDIQLVSDLLTPQASGQRLACRSIYDHTVLWSLMVSNGNNIMKQKYSE